MEIALILILVFAIVVFSIIRVFGNVVGAGGNLSKVSSDETDKNKFYEDVCRNNPTSQVFRTIGGVLFGFLLLCPILYSTRQNGEPFINMNHQVRDNLVGFLVVTEIMVFLAIWLIDRKRQKR